MKEWLEDIGFELKTYSRESIGNHQLFSSTQIEGEKILFGASIKSLVSICAPIDKGT